MKGNKVNNQDISVQVEVTGSLAEALNQMGKRMTQEVLIKAAKTGATVIAASIAERCPVDSGELKDDLGIQIDTSSNGVVATVGFMSSFLASIAYWVEHGHNNRVAKTALQKFFKQRHGNTIGMVPAHPFFRPGVDSAMRQSSEAVMGVITAALQSDNSTGVTETDSKAVAA